MMIPKLIIFDFDGVLVDTQRDTDELQWQYLKKDGLDIKSEEFSEKFSGHAGTSIVKHLIQNKNINVSKSTEEYAKDMGEVVLAQLTSQEIKCVKGVKEVFEKLFIKKCIASNGSSKNLRTLLSASGLDVYFDDNVFSAEKVENPKPSPEILFYAASAIGIDPCDCLVIEDRELGIQAACAAGMRSWGFVGSSPVISEAHNKLLKAGAEKTFDKMEDLLLL